MHKFAMFFAAFLVFVCANAFANNSAPPPLAAKSQTQFDDDAAKIRREMQPRGKYEYIDSSDRDKVESRLSEMQQLLAGHADVAELSSSDTTRFGAAQEEVNAILQHNDSERLICEMATTTGTTVPKKICRTFGEIERHRQQNGR